MKPFNQFLGRLALSRILNLSALSVVDRIQLALRLPSVTRLALRLFRDPRVSPRSKAVTLSFIGLVLSPFDIPGWVPVLGQVGDAVVIVNILDLFIKAAPRHVVNEHLRALGLEGKYKV